VCLYIAPLFTNKFLKIIAVCHIKAFIQTGPGAHPASYTMVTRSFPGVKPPGRGAGHPLHLAPRLRKEFLGDLYVYLYLYHIKAFRFFIELQLCFNALLSSPFTNTSNSHAKSKYGDVGGRTP
jgi:hypothetical protein